MVMDLSRSRRTRYGSHLRNPPDWRFWRGFHFLRFGDQHSGEFVNPAHQGNAGGKVEPGNDDGSYIERVGVANITYSLNIRSYIIQKVSLLTRLAFDPGRFYGDMHSSDASLVPTVPGWSSLVQKT
jgi:hypothetical protein